MAKPLTKVISSTAAKGATSRILRNRLALSTILAVSPFLGYGRAAYAACDLTGPSTYSCSDEIAGDIITAPNANVSTLATPPFVVTTDGLIVQGPGFIQFTDSNGSSITNTGYGAGLSVVSTGDIEAGADGAVTIVTNGTITGQKGDGIYAYNDGSGDLSITADGQVTGMDTGEFTSPSDGIYAVNYGNNLTITTGAQSAITGNDNAIDARNYGTGNLTITVEGKAKSYDYDGIFAQNGDPFFGENEADDLKITVGAQAVVDGAGNGIQAQNYGQGVLDITVDGSVTGQGYDGIKAVNEGTNLIIATGAQSTVLGNAGPAGTDSNGIDALNNGSGYLKITANGVVTGNRNDAIYARNYGTDLTIETGAQSVIKGGGNGIGAYNYGDGDLTITAYGVVGGYSDTGSGIKAVNNKGWVDDSTYNVGLDLTITTGAQSVVTGKSYGIYARNEGDGDLKITALGQVTGKTADGIYALLDGSEGYDVEILTGANSTVTGGRNGIYAQNYGYGKLSITTYGAVTGVGVDGDGIKAYNSSNGTYLSIVTGTKAVTGGDDGIQAENRGDGDLTITTNGVITGQNGNGITAINSSGEFYNPETESTYFSYGINLTVTTNAAVTGKNYGIEALNSGTGNLTITANADVTGQEADGIYAVNSAFGEDMTITTGPGSTVIGAGHALSVDNLGSGSVDITINGALIGEENNGILARNTSAGQDFTLTTGAGSVITGGFSGIVATSRGSGPLDITINGEVTGTTAEGLYASNEGGGATTIEIGANGLVQGSLVGLAADSTAGQPISITNYGTVRNISGLSGDLALFTRGAASTIDNEGDLIGTVTLSAFNDSLDNGGLWSTTGENDFGAGDEDEVNNRGTLLAAVDSGLIETPTLINLERFNNSGLVSLADGQAGDSLVIRGVLAGDANYASEAGRLAVDAVLGPDGISDELHIEGDVTDTTTVHVNVLGATGFNNVGIPVVRVFSGDTGIGDFVLDGPLNAGFFTWDMRFDDIENQHELFTSGIGIGAYEFAAGMTGAQDMWHLTTGTLLQRQADLRSLLEGTGVTPVADFGEPVAPTPVARVTPGFWFSGLGAYLERDDEQDGFTLDRKQTVWGGLAGFDFGTQDVGDALLFGLFAGYATSKLEFNETNTEWTYDGPTVGAYATYLDRAFFVDATVKVDFLNIEIDPEDVAPDADDSDTDAVNIGGRIDTGYKFGESVFIEPQASLAVVHTEIDDVDVFGGTVEFEDETSVRGRLGLRLGFDHQASDAVVYSGDLIASVWEDFSGDNDVTIATPGLPNFGLSDDPGATMGDVSLGFAVAAPEGWSGFLRGNYQFANDYDAYSGNAGVRYAW